MKACAENGCSRQEVCGVDGGLVVHVDESVALLGAYILNVADFLMSPHVTFFAGLLGSVRERFRTTGSAGFF